MVDFQIQKTGIIMGFGSLRYGSIEYPCVLHEAEINIYSVRMCRNFVSYPKQINGTWNILCAGEMDGSKDSCQVNNLYIPYSLPTFNNSLFFI